MTVLRVPFLFSADVVPKGKRNPVRRTCRDHVVVDLEELPASPSAGLPAGWVRCADRRMIRLRTAGSGGTPPLPGGDVGSLALADPSRAADYERLLRPDGMPSLDGPVMGPEDMSGVRRIEWSDAQERKEARIDLLVRSFALHDGYLVTDLLRPVIERRGGKPRPGIDVRRVDVPPDGSSPFLLSVDAATAAHGLAEVDVRLVHALADDGWGFDDHGFDAAEIALRLLLLSAGLPLARPADAAAAVRAGIDAFGNPSDEAGRTALASSLASLAGDVGCTIRSMDVVWRSWDRTALDEAVARIGLLGGCADRPSPDPFPRGAPR